MGRERHITGRAGTQQFRHQPTPAGGVTKNRIKERQLGLFADRTSTETLPGTAAALRRQKQLTPRQSAAPEAALAQDVLQGPRDTPGARTDAHGGITGDAG